MATKIYECLKKIGERIIENKEFLTDLDREIGDADHGLNMARGFQAVIDKVPQEEPDIGAVLKKTGMTLLSTVGGASGPLYGTAYMEAGKVFAGRTEIGPEEFLAGLDAAIAGIKKRGKAEKGEKTMLDALLPAREAFAAVLEGKTCNNVSFEGQSTESGSIDSKPAEATSVESRPGGSVSVESKSVESGSAENTSDGNAAAEAGLKAALDAACKAAGEGVEYTKTIAATKGRASYLGERSIGHQDPGATSAALTLEAIRDFLG